MQTNGTYVVPLLWQDIASSSLPGSFPGVGGVLY